MEQENENENENEKDNIIPLLGNLSLEKFSKFITKRGWSCSHCGENEYQIEEFATTGQCAVSSIPYVASSPNGQLFEAGIGAPLYTLLCTNCYAVTKYDAISVKTTIDEEACYGK